ncbi:MAG: substrate-binding domain-containing protein, partial [Coriobacteriales bacterium]
MTNQGVKKHGSMTIACSIFAVVMVLALGLALSGCGSNNSGGSSSSATPTTSSLSGSITAVGSTAIQPLVEAGAQQFQSSNPNVQITVQGGGSGQGLTQISEGAVQIGDSDLFAEEKLTDSSAVSKIKDNKV